MNTITLIEQSRLGDQAAFARIVRQYQGMVSAATLNVVGNYAQSEDLAQETFLTAWKKLPELREPEKLASWLYGIARRVALRWLEQQQRDPLRNYAELNSAELDADTITDQQAQLEAEERHRREQSLALVWTTVKDLPETLREPLLLYYRYSKSVADIAASLALTEEAVRQRLSRGRKMLKAEVEKQVESVLEATGPGEYFTVGVLASLSMLVTAPEVFAATSAAGSASAAAKSTGGVPLFAGIGAYLYTLINAVFFPLAIFFGAVFGAWNGIRNSPTLRSRRFMLKAAIYQTMMGLSLTVFFVVFIKGCQLFMPGMHGDSAMGKFVQVFCFAWMILIGLYCVISSYVINRRWRKIVEEDMTNPVDLDALERSSLSLRNLRKFLYRWMAMPFIAALPPILFTLFMFELHGFGNENRWQWYSVWIPHILLFERHNFRLPLMALGIIPVVSIFYHVVKRRVIDENSLTIWQPRILNHLQVLTGEDKPKRGLRYRTNLWSDLLNIGVALCILQGGIGAGYFSNTSVELGIQHHYLAVFVISFVAYLLFAMFFAGIPRKRYLGYIYLGLFIAVLNAVFVLFFELWLYPGLGIVIPRWHADGVVLGSVLFWLFCFVLSGVLGLYVFRKK